MHNSPFPRIEDDGLVDMPAQDRERIEDIRLSLIDHLESAYTESGYPEVNGNDHVAASNLAVAAEIAALNDQIGSCTSSLEHKMQNMLEAMNEIADALAEIATASRRIG